MCVCVCVGGRYRHDMLQQHPGRPQHLCAHCYCPVDDRQAGTIGQLARQPGLLGMEIGVGGPHYIHHRVDALSETQLVAQPLHAAAELEAHLQHNQVGLGQQHGTIEGVRNPTRR